MKVQENEIEISERQGERPNGHLGSWVARIAASINSKAPCNAKKHLLFSLT